MQRQSNTSIYRVGLFSDEPIRLLGLESVFEGHAFIRPVSGELEGLLADREMHAVVLDLCANSAWMEVQLMVRRVRPDIRQIVLGPSGSEELILRAITAGARGYLGASAGPLAVRQAVETVIQGSIWAPRRVLSLLIDRLLSHAGAGAAAQELSPRERQVLDLIMEARTNREIAQELGIEERTVKAYVANLLRKTGAENRVALSVRATQESLRDQRMLPS